MPSMLADHDEPPCELRVVRPDLRLGAEDGIGGPRALDLDDEDRDLGGADLGGALRALDLDDEDLGGV